MSSYVVHRLRIVLIYTNSASIFTSFFVLHIQRSKAVKEKPPLPGPRTRSRATAATTTNTEAKTSSAPKLINPTCSKLLKQCGNMESGSVAAYIALRERQKQNLDADPMIEDVGESSLQNAVEVVEQGNKT